MIQYQHKRADEQLFPYMRFFEKTLRENYLSLKIETHSRRRSKVNMCIICDPIQEEEILPSDDRQHAITYCNVGYRSYSSAKTHVGLGETVWEGRRAPNLAAVVKLSARTWHHIAGCNDVRIRESEDSTFQYFVLNIFMETSSKQTKVNHNFVTH